MLVYCPECNVAYEIDDSLIENKTRKLKCSNCGKIFTVGDLLFETPKVDVVDNKDSIIEENIASEVDATSNFEDVETKEIENPEVPEIAEAENDNSVEVEDATDVDDDNQSAADLEKIFERLSEHTEQLMAMEKKLPFYEKFWLQVKNILGLHFKIRWGFVLLVMLVVTSLSLFNNRYQLVREFPFLNAAYKALGIKARIPGENLEFQNISWEFFGEDGEENRRLVIKGFVYNTLDYDIEIPIIHIELLGSDTSLLQSINRKLEDKIIAAETKLPLNITVENPAPTAKYVYLTFIDED